MPLMMTAVVHSQFIRSIAMEIAFLTQMKTVSVKAMKSQGATISMPATFHLQQPKMTEVANSAASQSSTVLMDFHSRLKFGWTKGGNLMSSVRRPHIASTSLHLILKIE